MQRGVKTVCNRALFRTMQCFNELGAHFCHEKEYAESCLRQRNLCNCAIVRNRAKIVRC